jgi:hypothetical protein
LSWSWKQPFIPTKENFCNFDESRSWNIWTLTKRRFWLHPTIQIRTIATWKCFLLS